jgi:hypothetical protein
MTSFTQQHRWMGLTKLEDIHCSPFDKRINASRFENMWVSWRRKISADK